MELDVSGTLKHEIIITRKNAIIAGLTIIVAGLVLKFAAFLFNR